jgi:hypothetical protein
MTTWKGEHRSAEMSVYNETLGKNAKIEKKLPRPADILNPGLDVTASQSCLETT